MPDEDQQRHDHHKTDVEVACTKDVEKQGHCCGGHKGTERNVGPFQNYRNKDDQIDCNCVGRKTETDSKGGGNTLAAFKLEKYGEKVTDKSSEAGARDNHDRLSGPHTHCNRDKTLQDVPREGQNSRYLARSPHYVCSSDVPAPHVTRIRTPHARQNDAYRDGPDRIGKDNRQVRIHNLRIVEIVIFCQLNRRCIVY